MHRDSDAVKDPIAHVILNVTDMAATVAAIKAAGGSMDGEPRPFRNTGIVIGIAIDPAGNRIELIQRPSSERTSRRDRLPDPSEDTAMSIGLASLVLSPHSSPRLRRTRPDRALRRCQRINGPPNSRRSPTRFASSANTQRRRHVPESSAARRAHPAVRALRLERFGAAASPPCRCSILRTAWLTRSSYLWAHRAAAARQAGVTNDELRRIAQGPDAKGWDAFDAMVLRAADELHVDSFVSDATWQALSARYDTNQLVDLVDTVGTLTMHAGAINSLGVEIEPDVPDRLPTGIPTAVAAKRTNVRLLWARAARIPPLEPRDWTPEQRKRFDPNGTGQRAANVFVTFVRNPPADRLRGPINQHILNATTLSVQAA